MSICEKTSSSHFRWNAGGWFGSQLGSSAWLLAGAYEFYLKDSFLTGLFLSTFIAFNALCLSLWYQRDKVAPYTGYMTMTSCFSIMIGAFVAALHWRGFGAFGPVWIIGLGPAVMARVFLAERHARKH